MKDTTYILQYKYDEEGPDAWRVEDVFYSALDAHLAFTQHVKDFAHITARIVKVHCIKEENTVASFQPISSEEYEQ